MTLILPRTDVFSNGAFIAQRFRLMGRSNITRLQNGSSIVKNFGSAIWTGELTLRPKFHDDAIDFEAIINSLDDGVHSFYGYDIRRPFPRNYPTGAFTDSFTIKSIGGNNKSVRLQNGPPNFVLRRGDYFHFNYTAGGYNYRALHQLMEDITADATGLTGLVEVRPHFRFGVAPDLAVKFKYPSALFSIEPGSWNPGTEDILRSGGSLQIFQTGI